MAIEELELRDARDPVVRLVEEPLDPGFSGKRAAALVLYWSLPPTASDQVRDKARTQVRDLGGSDPDALELARRIMQDVATLIT